MKFKIEIEEAETSRTWWEEYDQPRIEDIEEAKAWAAETLTRFNRTLRPNERARKILRVESIGGSTEHKWVKTSMVTQVGTHHLKGKTFDAYRCEKCGITGKRFRLDGPVVRDPAYRQVKFGICSGAKPAK